MGFCGSYFSPSGPTADFTSAIELLDEFDRAPLTVTEVSARVRVRAGVRELFLSGARARPSRVRPGQRVRVTVTGRLRRGGRARSTFTLRVPGSLRPGRLVLRLRGEGAPQSADEALEQELSDLLGGGEDREERQPPPVRTIGDLAERIGKLRSVHGLRLGRRFVLKDSRTLYRGSARLRLRVTRR
jgi:hypothetical protein